MQNKDKESNFQTSSVGLRSKIFTFTAISKAHTTKALITRSVKTFVHRAFSIFLIYFGSVLLYAENFIWLKKKTLGLRNFLAYL